MLYFWNLHSKCGSQGVVFGILRKMKLKATALLGNYDHECI